MSNASEMVCVIHDGSLAAVVACLMSPEPGAVVCWIPPVGSSPCGETVTEETARLVGQTREILGFDRVIVAGAEAGAPWGISRLLLEAVAAARAVECGRVIWPVVCGADVERLSWSVERAGLVSRLAELDMAETSDRSRSRRVTIEIPLADLTPAQIAEMADDLDAPLDGLVYSPNSPLPIFR